MIFSPELSCKNLAAINNACLVKFTDCTYGNDLTDSIIYDDNTAQIVIMLPNCTELSEDRREEFTDFVIKATVNQMKFDLEYLEDVNGIGAFDLPQCIARINEFVREHDILQNTQFTKIFRE